jgi:hypothetical protein
VSDCTSSRRIEKQSGVVNAEGGFVLLDGPDGVAITLTPEAAAEMGRNLIKAARVAAKQTAAIADEGFHRIY